MAASGAPVEPRYFAAAADFRAWLQAHAATTPELLVGFHKVGSGQPSMSWPESVDEALCVGWIDGVRKRIDDGRYQIRFTPRKMVSHWSAINIERIAVLIEQGRVGPAGLAAFARRQEGNSRRAAYEQPEAARLDPVDEKAFRRQRAAWAWFEAQAPSYRQTLLHWVTRAKQAATRQRRLAQLIEACAAGRRL